MGFFKKAANKLKRVVSLKNATNLVTGQWSAVAKDAVRVVTTERDWERESNGSPSVLPAVEIPTPVNDILNSQGKAFSAKVVTKVAGEKGVQEATSLLTDIYLTSLYKKYKAYVWVVGSLLIGGILYKVFGKKKPINRYAKRR